MDDPWGSPWADETPHPQILPNVEGKAPVTRDPPLSLQQDPSSPWDDDDGFGEWATIPEDSEPLAQIEDEKWSPHEDAITDSDLQGNGDIKTEAWEGGDVVEAAEETTELDLSGQNISKNTWANTARSTHEDEVQQSAVASPERDGTIRAVDELDRLEAEVIHNHEIEKNPASIDTSSPPEKENRQDARDESATKNDSEENLSGSKAISEKIEDGQQTFSRPSSSPSDHSQQNPALAAESPRTSFEEDLKRPPLEKQDSSRVKQLVQLFDGFAVEPLEVDVVGTHLLKPSDREDGEIRDMGGNDSEDFDDFEDGVSYVSSGEKHQNDPITEASDASPVQEGTIVLHETKLSSVGEAKVANEVAEETLPRSLGTTTFNPDISLLDKLYEGAYVDTKETSKSATLESLGAGSIIADSFDTVQQRKTWYRVSRYGTMRKHNAGEDDYARIDWVHSSARHDTLEIVARWMTEDRIAGGVVLGGSSKLGSLFGWGKTQELPTSNLAASHGPPEQHHTAISSPAIGKGSFAPITHERRVSITVLPTSRKSLEPPPLETAQFSWSTEQPVPAKSVSSSIMSLAFPEQPSKTGLVATPHDQFSSNSLTDASFRPATTVKVAIAEVKPKGLRRPTPIVVNDDDDEWGEMVESPAAPSASAPTFLVTTAGDDRKSVEIDVVPDQTMQSAPNVNDAKATSPYQENPEVTQAIFSPTQNSFSPISPPGVHDAWTAADFSMFDSPAPVLPLHSSSPAAMLPSEPALPSSAGKHQKSREEQEQDEAVERIIHNLPDLSYMFRR